MLNFLKRLADRRGAAKADAHAKYRALVTKAADRGDLSDADTIAADDVMQALAIQPEEFAGDVAAVKQLRSLEEVAATAASLADDREEARVALVESRKTIDSRIEDLKQQHIAIEAEFKATAAKHSAALAATEEIEKLKRRHARIFDADVARI